MTVQANVVVVNLGEVKVSKDPQTVLTCLGLGSCVGLCMYDPVSKVGGMAHIVLPVSFNGGTNNTKFADVAVPSLLQRMREQGAVRARLVTKLVGGSQMLKQGTEHNFNTGQRNVEATNKVLSDEAIAIAAADVGGNRGRSLKLFVESGKVLVKSIGASDVEL